MKNKSNKIHGSVIIEGNVVLGENNIIEPYAVLRGPLVIGNNNYIGCGSIIGMAGENTRDPYKNVDDKMINIGNDCIIKENVVIHKACFEDVTYIGNGVFIMHGSHIAHDCKIYDNAVITPNTTLGGIVTICEGANVALGCNIHQYSVIGHYSIVGMGTSILKNIRPFTKYVPNKPPLVNYYSVKKFGFSYELGEIEDFVIKKKLPDSGKIRTIIDDYLEKHARSQRSEY